VRTFVDLLLTALGNALLIAGGVGILLLGQGAFPRELIPNVRGVRAAPRPFMGSSWAWRSPEYEALLRQIADSSRGSSSGPMAVARAAPGERGPGEDPGNAQEVEAAAPLEDVEIDLQERLAALASLGAVIPQAEATAVGVAGLSGTPTVTPTPRPTRTPSPPVQPFTLPPEKPRAPITKLKVARIRIEADVVPSRLINWFGVTTWEVPAFRVGHGVLTAGAGEPGNAVLLGHVTSISEGNVFRNLSQARVGDVVQVLSEDVAFDYEVEVVKQVPRTDLSMLEPTAEPVVTLVTCVGEWLEDIQDYSHRLIVRAALTAAHRTPTATLTPTVTLTPTETARPTETSTPGETGTPAATPTPTAMATAMATATRTSTATATATASATPTPVPPTATATATPSRTPTRTATPNRG
jgi:LPXTG-site transpeptidase (sortase) family protein